MVDAPQELFGETADDRGDLDAGLEPVERELEQQFVQLRAGSGQDGPYEVVAAQLGLVVTFGDLFGADPDQIGFVAGVGRGALAASRPALWEIAAQLIDQDADDDGVAEELVEAGQGEHGR